LNIMIQFYLDDLNFPVTAQLAITEHSYIKHSAPC
jgi:hypothetical protein